MITREKIMAEIEKIPEQYLEELYRIIKEFEINKKERSEADESLMTKLRRINISASPDFSTKVNFTMSRKSLVRSTSLDFLFGLVDTVNYEGQDC